MPLIELSTPKIIIVVSSNVHIMHMNYRAVSLNATEALDFSKTSEKIITTVFPSNLNSQKTYPHHFSKQMHCMQTFLSFHVIEYMIVLSNVFL